MRALLLLALGLLGLFAGLAALAHGGQALPGELVLGRWLQSHAPPQSVLFQWARWASRIDHYLLWALCAFLLYQRRLLAVLTVALSGWGIERVEAPIKHLVARARPAAGTLHILEVRKGFGFPSGGALFAGALCAAALFTLLPLVRGQKRWAVAMIVCAWAGLAGLSRTLVGAHWPYDVVGGWSGGAGWGLGCAWLLYRLTLSGSHKEEVSRKLPSSGDSV
jgi:undecaprenyl-diphosphatase